jgi:SAM-dependent methyltransferase
MKKTDNYVGIDISKEMLKIARKNIPNGVFLKETMTSLKINDKFDYISFFGSLHHSPNPHFTLKNIVRFLKPDGYLFLREPSNKAFVKGNGLTLDEEGLDLVDLRNNLKKLGFYIVSFNTINSKNFNTIRRLLQRAHLSFWEKFIESWILKTKIEFFLQKILPSKITDNFGLDFLIVARRVKETKNKKKISKKKNSK